MTSHSKQTLTLVLLVACLVAVAASPAAAQSEMTSKIRLECAAGVGCTNAAQYDFSVENEELVISKVGGGVLRLNGTTGRLGLGTLANPEEKLTVNGASGPGTVALFINPAGPARFRFRNGSNGETW